MRVGSGTLGQFVATRRHEMNLSQTKVANMLGRSRGWVCNLERGVAKNFELGLVPKLANVLRCKVGDIRKQLQLAPSNKLGQMVRLYRTQHGLTVAEFATMLGIKAETVYGWEAGRHTVVTYAVARKLVALLKVKTSKFSSCLGINCRPTLEKFGVVIRRYRQLSMLSQPELGGRLGVSKQYVSQIELGQATLAMSDEFVQKLVNVLSVPPELLIKHRPRRRNARV